jgi:hypothetical protein
LFEDEINNKKAGNEESAVQNKAFQKLSAPLLPDKIYVMTEIRIFENLLLLFTSGTSRIGLCLCLGVFALFPPFLFFGFLRPLTYLLGLIHGAVVMLRLLDHLCALNKLVLRHYIPLNRLLFADVTQLAEHDLKINGQKGHGQVSERISDP